MCQRMRPSRPWWPSPQRHLQAPTCQLWPPSWLQTPLCESLLALPASIAGQQQHSLVPAYAPQAAQLLNSAQGLAMHGNTRCQTCYCILPGHILGSPDAVDTDLQTGHGSTPLMPCPHMQVQQSDAHRAVPPGAVLVHLYPQYRRAHVIQQHQRGCRLLHPCSGRHRPAPEWPQAAGEL